MLSNLSHSLIYFLLVVVGAAFLVSPATATDHIVGANKGWNPGMNYTDWANNQTFFVGDFICKSPSCYAYIYYIPSLRSFWLYIVVLNDMWFVHNMHINALNFLQNFNEMIRFCICSHKLCLMKVFIWWQWWFLHSVSPSKKFRCVLLVSPPKIWI